MEQQTMDQQHIDLPEEIVLIARPDEESGKLAFIKPRSPEGKDTPVAFTDEAKAKHFLKETGMDKVPVSLVALNTADILEGMLSSGEVDICINPLDESETFLRYDEPNAIERRQAPDENSVEVCPAKEALEPSLLKSLHEVAATMPVIEKIWHLEIREKDSEEAMRTLLIVDLQEGASQDDYDQTFMILGVDWCETLPRGMALDMMPLNSAPANAGVDQLDAIYVKAL